MLLLVTGASGVGKSTARIRAVELRHLHLGFADWMRVHAVDPSYVPEAVTNDSWESMGFERWVGRLPGPEWAMTVVDTSAMSTDEVGVVVAEWCRRAVRGECPLFRAGWHSGG